MVAILGTSQIIKQQAINYILSKNRNPKISCSLEQLISFYIEESEIEGVRWDIVLAQSILETGCFSFGGQVLPEQNNFCGLGALNNETVGKGAWFNTPKIGIRAQVQHLIAYCSTKDLSRECVDPRFNLVERGVAANLEDLAGKWAYPGYDSSKYHNFEEAYQDNATYGQLILNLINEISKQDKGDNKMKIAIRRGHQRTGKDGCASGLVNEIDVANAYYSKALEGFRQLGHEVLDVTPPEDNRSLGDSLSYGINMANDFGAELFISCHANNAYDTYDGAIGCEVIYHPNSTKGKEYAVSVEKEIANLGFRSRGAKADVRQLAEINSVNCPTIIIEPFFVEATEDVALYNKVGPTALANAIIKGITGEDISTSNSPALPNDFSEEYYLKYNNDIREAVAAGTFKNGAEHYLQHGYKEDRKYKKEPSKYLVTRYLPVAYSGYNGVDVDSYTHKYFEDVKCYVRSDSKGIWLESAYIDDEEKLNRIANNLNNDNLYYAVV